MKRIKKIRGHKRIWRHIDIWKSHLKHLDISYLRENERDYVKVWVPPYRNISITNSSFSPPKGKTRQKIIEGIFEIYANWKNQLDNLGESYYLKIWYFPQDVSKCQVVCAMGDSINYYSNTFFNPRVEKLFPEDPKSLRWKHRIQEFHITEEDIDEPDLFTSYDDYLENKRWVESKMKDPRTRIWEGENSYGIPATVYSFKEYDVWVGGE